ncbi:hypothetical protein L6452_05692 [Arctium lappa]|uniref:Uncharacterized protein n=1 Tax=Arctium lappa TaxID=4217 RepID=A0ACB9EHE4_ARCLA|nr:hypothetical protein L6452_05692 [Arctium lappa]
MRNTGMLSMVTEEIRDGLLWIRTDGGMGSGHWFASLMQICYATVGRSKKPRVLVGSQTQIPRYRARGLRGWVVAFSLYWYLLIFFGNKGCMEFWLTSIKLCGWLWRQLNSQIVVFIRSVWENATHHYPFHANRLIEGNMTLNQKTST